jgi:hypothetical protein
MLKTASLSNCLHCKPLLLACLSGCHQPQVSHVLPLLLLPLLLLLLLLLT